MARGRRESERPEWVTDARLDRDMLVRLGRRRTEIICERFGLQGVPQMSVSEIARRRNISTSLAYRLLGEAVAIMGEG